MDPINNEPPIYSVITGNLNAKCTNWCNKDNTNSVSREIDTLTSSAGYNQIINKPTHIGQSSCIDLIFGNNLNLISNYAVDQSLFENCYQNIIFGKINIRIPLPPSYVCEMWDYSSAHAKNIQKAVPNFDWEKTLENF